jgi:hypothetical protein
VPTGAQKTLAAFAVAVGPFVLLCTGNSAGYRYGASDQAFYVPAVLARMDPSLFPRDGALIASQARLTLIDETIGALAQLTSVSLPALFVALYCVTLCLLAAAGCLIAGRLYRSHWATVAFVAALTLRHAITTSGTNTLEGYFHPRQLAFALGALAIAALLRDRLAPAAALVLLAGILHPTTALWFAIWAAVAAAVNDRRARMPVGVAAGAAAIAGVWAVTAGPIAGRLEIMDSEWLATLASKDYLFPIDWPVSVWLINLGYAPLIVLLYHRRRAAGLLVPGERGVVMGCLSLLVVFTIALPLTAAHVALAVQLQTPRTFWMLDFLGTLYVVWALAEGTSGRVRRAQITAAVILLASATRSLYVLLLRFPDRPVAQVRVADNDWGRVMAWARTTPADTGWLADPMHAVKYGTSVRVAGERDVLVEAVKDVAIGMYARDIAIRTRDRIAAAGNFDAMTSEHARSLAARYGLDYVVTEHTLALPMAFESGPLHVYRLR